VVCAVFVFVRVAPGDPVYYIGGFHGTEEYYDRIRAELGLDRPVHVQFLIYMGNVIKGDLGHSVVFQEPVTPVVLERLLNTVILTYASIALAAVIGIILGVFASRKHYSLSDNVISTLSLIGYSQPLFWTAMILVLIFTGTGVPILGMTTVGKELRGLHLVFDFLKHLFLPAMALSIYQIALFTRITRSSMLEVLLLDFITTAKSEGLSEWRILLRHGLRNALIPLVTLIGLQMGYMFSGAALIEVVFSWPGVGVLMLDAVLSRDYSLLNGIFIFVSIAVILSNLLADVIYAKLDPRITY